MASLCFHAYQKYATWDLNQCVTVVFTSLLIPRIALNTSSYVNIASSDLCAPGNSGISQHDRAANDSTQSDESAGRATRTRLIWDIGRRRRRRRRGDGRSLTH
ncbi:hypothetical protein ANN_20627 [Periplaneta americana]|uniref:Uncharacterized protein n=1 Tax=Periplaneta americana TaxID=6978 RepID=A0ABQ8SD40_PERAM|nr:hypothetical protein ANN_20627 [Periplaneta americana]